STVFDNKKRVAEGQCAFAVYNPSLPSGAAYRSTTLMPGSCGWPNVSAISLTPNSIACHRFAKVGLPWFRGSLVVTLRPQNTVPLISGVILSGVSLGISKFSFQIFKTAVTE